MNLGERLREVKRLWTEVRIMDLVIEPLTSGWITAMGWARALSKTQRGTVKLKRQTVRESRRGLRLRRSHFSMNRQMDFVP